MDDPRFDALAKTLGTAHSRRRLAQILGGLSLGGVFAALETSDALAAKRKGGAPCTRNGQCKTGKCLGPAGNKQCSCSKKFRACVQPAGGCMQATCDFATKLCVTTNKAAGAACPDDNNKCTTDICDGGGVCTHPNKTNGVDCGNGKTCQSGECTSGLQCPTDCAGDKICDGSTGSCTCPATRPVQCLGNNQRCTTDPNTDSERCGLNCVDCAVSAAPGANCCGGVCVTGCGPNSNGSCAEGPCGSSCTPCSGGQLCCNLGSGTSSGCVDPHPVSGNCPPPPS
jgi:hypothetical protein